MEESVFDGMYGCEPEVCMILEEVGISPGRMGYIYLMEAGEMLAEDPDRINAVHKEIYPVIAERHAVTPGAVERGIRTAIAKSYIPAWQNKQLLYMMALLLS